MQSEQKITASSPSHRPKEASSESDYEFVDFPALIPDVDLESIRAACRFKEKDEEPPAEQAIPSSLLVDQDDADPLTEDDLEEMPSMDSLLGTWIEDAILRMTHLIPVVVALLTPWIEACINLFNRVRNVERPGLKTLIVLILSLSALGLYGGWNRLVEINELMERPTGSIKVLPAPGARPVTELPVKTRSISIFGRRDIQEVKETRKDLQPVDPTRTYPVSILPIFRWNFRSTPPATPSLSPEPTKRSLTGPYQYYNIWHPIIANQLRVMSLHIQKTIRSLVCTSKCAIKRAREQVLLFFCFLDTDSHRRKSGKTAWVSMLAVCVAMWWMKRSRLNSGP